MLYVIGYRYLCVLGMFIGDILGTKGLVTFEESPPSPIISSSRDVPPYACILPLPMQFFFLNKKKIATSPFRAATIHIGRQIVRLPYAGYFFKLR